MLVLWVWLTPAAACAKVLLAAKAACLAAACWLATALFACSEAPWAIVFRPLPALKPFPPPPL